MRVWIQIIELLIHTYIHMEPLDHTDAKQTLLIRISIVLNLSSIVWIHILVIWIQIIGLWIHNSVHPNLAVRTHTEQTLLITSPILLNQSSVVWNKSSVVWTNILGNPNLSLSIGCIIIKPFSPL